MKALVFVVLAVASSYVQADETPKAIVAYLIDARVSGYAPKDSCSDSSITDKEVECFSDYYVYLLKPETVNKNARPISVAFVSHSPWLHRSKHPWLLKIQKIDEGIAKQIGADYELIDSALIDGDRCASSSIPLNTWLFPPPPAYTVFEKRIDNDVQFRGSFCYRSSQ